jgi:nitrite reductase/ring-hydroxylating ferredoxin subunit
MSDERQSMTAAVSAALAEGECREFSSGTDSVRQDCFVVCKDGKLYAYENRCPHIGASLNWTPDTFLNTEGDLIQCANHGALFRITDGYCVQGPCAGASLTPVNVEIEDGLIRPVQALNRSG